MLHCVTKLDYLCNCKSEISNVCNAVEGHCFQAMKIVHHYVNSCFDWFISGHQSVNPSREAISILPGKYKRFMFVHPVARLKVKILKYDAQASYGKGPDYFWLKTAIFPVSVFLLLFSMKFGTELENYQYDSFK